MTKRHRDKRIYRNFVISYIITLLLPMSIMSFIVLFNFVNVLSDEVEKNMLNPLMKSIDNFDSQIDQLTKTTLQIEMNDFLRTANIDKTPYDAIEVEDELLKYNTNSFVDNIFFYKYNDDYVASFNYSCKLNVFNDFVLSRNTNSFDPESFMKSGKQEAIYYFPEDSINIASSQKHLMYLNKVPVNSSSTYGFVMYTIPQSSLESILKPATNENSFVYIVDPQTRKIMFDFAAENPSLTDSLQQVLNSSDSIYDIDHKKILHNEYSSYVFGSQKTPYVFVQVTSADFLFSKIRHIRAIFFISMLVIIVLSGIVIAILMRINYRPIKKMKKFLDEAHLLSVKNTEKSELNELELMEYALLQYDKENTNLKEFAKANKDVVISYLVDCFLAGQAKKIDNILETCSKADLYFDKDHYRAMILKGSVMKDISIDTIKDDTAEFINPEKTQIIVHRDIHLNNIVIILGNAVEAEAPYRSLALKLIKRCNERYREEFLVGIGSFYDSIFNIDSSYQEALRVLDYNNIIYKSNIFSFTELSEHSDANINYPFTLFNKLEIALRKKEVFCIKDVIEKLVCYIRDENLSLYWAKNICFSVVNTIPKELSKTFDYSPLLNKPYTIKIFSNNINTFEDIEKIMQEISDDIASYLDSDKGSYELKLLQQIVHYIRDNCLNPEFSLQSLADSLQMSRPYLSQYFKKNTDYTISEYVTRLRMEKAKEMLIESEKSVQEIACTVGYYSVSSFIRTFREKENTTPGQFKRKYI